VTNIDPLAAEALERINDSALRVQEWFRQATSRFKVPCVETCKTVAIYLEFFRASSDTEKISHEQTAKDTRPQAFKAGKDFLRYIEPQRREAEHLIILSSEGCRVVPYWLDHAEKVSFSINEIKRHLAALESIVSPKLDGKPDPIRKIAEVAQFAWAEANDQRYPIALGPGGPLCKFLDVALAAINRRSTPDTISAVLRNRRRVRQGRF
jgi:hypothetical protein